MRKLVYYVASTVDGFIARKDGSFDCLLNEGEHVTDYLASFAWFDTVLMGRKTYEVGLQFGVTNPYPMLRQFVISQTMTAAPDPNVELIRDDVIARVEALKAAAGKDIYLCGGAELATRFFQAGLIDEVILKLNPLLLGTGIGLVTGLDHHLDLTLTKHKVYENGVILLFYTVNKTALAVEKR